MKEFRICIHEKEFQNILREIEACGLSNSDYLKLMYLFGKFFVSDGKMIIDPDNLKNKVWAFITSATIFNTNLPKADLEFLAVLEKKIRGKKD